MNLQSLTNDGKKVVNYIWIHREAVLIIIIAILLFFLLHRKPISSTTVVVDPLTLDSLHQQRDLNGKLYAIIAQKIVAMDDQGKIMDSLAKALKLKIKAIDAATIIIHKTDTFFRDTGRVKLVLIGGDTAHIVQKHDAWIDISAYAFLNPKKFFLDSISFKFRDSLYFIETHKTHLFAPTEYQVIVKSANPYIQSIQGASYRVREKQSWLTLILGGGYNLLPVTTWSVGAYIGYPVLSLKR